MTIFFFNDTATTEIYTLSLHDALPISIGLGGERVIRLLGPGGRAHAERLDDDRPITRADEERDQLAETERRAEEPRNEQDRKSTRLNSSHGYISYAVFCLKKKKKQIHRLL